MSMCGYWDSTFWSRKYTLAWLMVKGSQWRKIGGHGHNGTIFCVLEECYRWHFQVSTNDWRTVQKWHKNKTQCAPANERSHRNSFSTPKGKSIQALFSSLITWLLFPMRKRKCNLAFHRYYGNDKADSEQNYRLEAVLLYTEEKVLQMQETKSKGPIHTYREQIYDPLDYSWWLWTKPTRVVQISNGILTTHSAFNFQNPKCLWINFSTVALLT